MSRKNRLEIIARFKNSVPHVYTDGELICSSKNKIYVIKDFNNPQPLVIGEIPWRFFQKMSHIRMLDRYLKHSILQVHRTTDRDYLVCNGHSWWHITSQGVVSYVKKFSRTRPMNRGICESKSKITYIAEYIPNPDRGSVRIFRSKDCRTFNIAWEFPARSIGHVHALIVDPESANRIWVLTGDTNAESHIYFTDNDFRTLKCFLSAGQKTRITDFIIRNNHLFWAPDSPRVASILCVNKQSPNDIKELHKLPGPVFYTSENEAGTLFFGTSPPMRVKSGNYAHIFALRPDNSCQEVYNCKKDFIPQYGIFYFPKGVLPENFIVFAQRALKPYEGYLTIARDNMW